MRKHSLWVGAHALACFLTLAAAATAVADDSIAELQGLMADGEISSEQLTTQALRKTQRLDHLNAFISVDQAGALSEARQLDRERARGVLRGPLHGIPVAIKDNIHVKGMPNTAGTPVFGQFVPSTDAPTVTSLKSAGAIVLGKTNMHELAYGITSNNAAFGAVGNVCDPAFIAGGSSGGTAVAIAAGMAIAGLGTDTGGSSRIPAALNGIVGFRPTIGRYPSAGITRISSTRDTVGPMARNVADAALLDAVLAGGSPELPNVALEEIRLGIPREHFYQNLEPLVAERIEALLHVLREAGVVLVEAGIPDVESLNSAVSFPVVLFETGVLLRSYLADHVPEQTIESLADSIASGDVRNIIAGVSRDEVPESAYRQALDRDRPQLKSAYADYFREHKVDAILFPTTPLTARPIAEAGETVELNGAQVPTFPTYIRNTDPGSNAGIPGLSIPLPVADGQMPVGVEIDGPEGSDRRLLAIGAAIEGLTERISP